MNINNRFRYAVHCKGIEGKKREKTLLDWFLIMGVCALILYLMFSIGNQFVSGAKAATPDLCGLDVVECPGEPIIPVKQVRYEEAYVTYYSKEDSCHYPDGKGGCLTASGLVAKDGFVACARDISFGSEIEIDGKTYHCQDRYASWLDTKRDRPTVDVWTSNSASWAREQGIKKAIIGIVE